MKKPISGLLVFLFATSTQAETPIPAARSTIITCDDGMGPEWQEKAREMTASELWRDMSAKIESDAAFWNPPGGSLVADTKHPHCQSADFGREFDALVLGVINDIGKKRYADAQQKIALFQMRLRCLTKDGVTFLDTKLSNYLRFALKLLPEDRKKAAIQGTFNLGVLVTDELLYTGSAHFLWDVNERHPDVKRLMQDYPWGELGIFLHEKNTDTGDWLKEQPAKNVLELYNDRFNFGLGLCSQKEMLQKGGICSKGACDPETHLETAEPRRRRRRFGKSIKEIQERMTETRDGKCYEKQRTPDGASGSIQNALPCAMLALASNAASNQVMCRARALGINNDPFASHSTKIFRTPIDRSCMYSDPADGEDDDDQDPDEDNVDEDDETEEMEEAEEAQEDAKDAADDAAEKNRKALLELADEAEVRGDVELAEKLRKAAEAPIPAFDIIPDDAPRGDEPGQNPCAGDASACYDTETGQITIKQSCLEDGRCYTSSGTRYGLETAMRHEVYHHQFDFGEFSQDDHDHNGKTKDKGDVDYRLCPDGPGGCKFKWINRTPNPMDDGARSCGDRSNVAAQIAALYECAPNYVQPKPISKSEAVTDPHPELFPKTLTGVAACFDPNLMNRMQSFIATSLTLCPEIYCPSDGPCTCAKGLTIKRVPALIRFNGPDGAIDPGPDDIKPPGRCFLPGCR